MCSSPSQKVSVAFGHLHTEGFVLTCIALPGIGQCTALQKLSLAGCKKFRSLYSAESEFRLRASVVRMLQASAWSCTDSTTVLILRLHCNMH